jgi:hypothetical protein
MEDRATEKAIRLIQMAPAGRVPSSAGRCMRVRPGVDARRAEQRQEQDEAGQAQLHRVLGTRCALPSTLRASLRFKASVSCPIPA